MYRHERVMRIMRDAERLVGDLFARYSAEPEVLPEEWRHGLDGGDAGQRARHIADFIAGMTDRFALTEPARRFDSTPGLRELLALAEPFRLRRQFPRFSMARQHLRQVPSVQAVNVAARRDRRAAGA
jgi:hypothetical protein